MNALDIPKLGFPLIETHCHLDYLKKITIPTMIEQALGLGVEKMITISVNPDNFSTVLELSSSYKYVYGTQGVHPHHADHYDDQAEKKLSAGLADKKIVAVGEIGLDYHYNHSSKKNQLKAFQRQLDLALSQNLPVVIHSRDAETDTIQVLSSYLGKIRGVIHSFTAKRELADFALEAGFYLGFNGIITFKNAESVRDILRITPLERVLLETDSPFLAPVPYRGKENNPCLLPFVAQESAKIKEISIQEVSNQTYANAEDLFFSDLQH